ncbi:MAG: hypothetical protein U0805_18190 [Pirellulales bacterium]
MTESGTQISPAAPRSPSHPCHNPFDSNLQRDHHEIWDALIARDSDAFAAADWSICADDFSTECFDGISAHGSLNPVEWTLRYPTVDSYRDDWLRMADEFLAIPLAVVSHRELLYRMQHLARIEISAGRAVVWKQFRADEPLTTGGSYEIQTQSVYRLHQIEGRWLIVGFVGYLPLES